LAFYDIPGENTIRGLLIGIMIMCFIMGGGDGKKMDWDKFEAAFN